MNNITKDNIRPHNVKIEITFNDDKSTKILEVNWDIIDSLRNLHNTCAVSSIYNNYITTNN